jgi:hypothetical protein
MHMYGVCEIQKVSQSPHRKKNKAPHCRCRVITKPEIIYLQLPAPGPEPNREPQYGVWDIPEPQSGAPPRACGSFYFLRPLICKIQHHRSSSRCASSGPMKEK